MRCARPQIRLNKLGTDRRAYERRDNIDGGQRRDYYAVDLKTGTRTPIKKTARYPMLPSPDGTKGLFYDDGEYQGIAPAYDILPMRYASVGGGIDPELTPIEPKIGSIGAKPAVWQRAALAAERFWLAAQTQTLAIPLSPKMRRLAAQNLEVARTFAAPLLPAASAHAPPAKPSRRQGVARGRARN